MRFCSSPFSHSGHDAQTVQQLRIKAMGRCRPLVLDHTVTGLSSDLPGLHPNLVLWPSQSYP
jgi:hypothetical protein